MLYCPEINEIRDRLTTWWNGGELGRPVVMATVPRQTPLEDIPALPQPPGWVTGYSTRSFDYRVNLSARAFLHSEFLCEAVPAVAPDLAPNCLALYLGCKGIESPGTVWCEPFVHEPRELDLRFDPENFYWNFTLRLGREQVRLGRGKFAVAFPDLIEGLDTLAALRGTETLLVDLIERPDWVHRCLRRITDRYFHYYDMLYNLIRDERGGSFFWSWAPGRMSKFQCDFSAMISPTMFGEFMAPVLREMCQRVSYSMYHWDGPGAIPHHDHLLAIPELKCVQWTAGDGHEPSFHPRWWPLYHKTIEAGKRIFVGGDTIERLLAMKKEFGRKFQSFMIGTGFGARAEAEEVIKRLYVD